MPVFNSRDPIYRSPTGAVADGTRVHFKISVPRNMRCSAAYMLMQGAAGTTRNTSGGRATIPRPPPACTSIILSCAPRAAVP